MKNNVNLRLGNQKRTTRPILEKFTSQDDLQISQIIAQITNFKAYFYQIYKDLVIFAFITKILMNLANIHNRQILMISLSAIMICGIAFLPSFAQMPESNNADIPPPLKQITNGIPIYEIKCNEPLHLIVRPFSDSPICVAENTAQKIADRLEWILIINHPETVENSDDNYGSFSGAPAHDSFGWESILSISHIPILGEDTILTLKSTQEFPKDLDYPENYVHDAQLYFTLSNGFEFVQGGFVKTDEGNNWKQYSKNVTSTLVNPANFTDTITVHAVKEGEWRLTGNSGYDISNPLYITIGKNNSTLHDEAFPVKPTLGIGIGNGILVEGPVDYTTMAMQGFDPDSPVQQILANYKFEPLTEEEEVRHQIRNCMARQHHENPDTNPYDYEEFCKIEVDKANCQYKLFEQNPGSKYDDFEEQCTK